MAKTQLINAGTHTTITADGYFCINGRMALITTETQTQITFRQGGTIANLGINISANTTTACSFYVRQNAGNSAVTVAFASGETGIKEDISNSFTVTADDEINYFADVTSGSSITIVNAVCTFDSSTNTYKLFSSNIAPLGQNDALTRYFSFHSGAAQTTETNVQCEMLQAGTFKHFFANVTANTHTTATSTFSLRKNASATGCPNVVYAATETGFKEDTSTTIAVSDADNCNFSIVTAANAGTTTVTWTTMSIGFETTNSKFQNYSNVNSVAVAFNTTTYCPIDSAVVFDTTESLKEVTSRLGSVNVTELLADVSANNINTGNSTIDFRVNRQGNYFTLTYAASETGTKTSAGSHSIADGDEINYRVVTSGASGNLTLQQLASLMSYTLPPLFLNALYRAKYRHHGEDENEEIN